MFLCLRRHVRYKIIQKLFTLHFRSFTQDLYLNQIPFQLSSSGLNYQSGGAPKLRGLVHDANAKFKTEGEALSSVLKLALSASPWSLAAWATELSFGLL